MMTHHMRRVAMGLFIWMIGVTAASAQPIPFDSERWEISGAEHEVVMYQGKQSVYLKGASAALSDVSFTTGIIEFDINFSDARGFMGAFWRLQDPNNFEQFYVRPHQSGKPDACQYTPIFNQLAGWQLYHGPGYGEVVNFRFDVWQHVKIVVGTNHAEVYIDSNEPILVTQPFKHDTQAGPVGVYSGNFAGAYFANFQYQALANPPMQGTPPESETAPDNAVMTWDVSSPFDEASLAEQTTLNRDATAALTWQTVPAEASGVVNLAQYAVIDEGADTVFARTTIAGRRGEVRTMKIGYSDRVRVYLNGKLVYAGDNGYQSRDFRYLGTIGLFDTVVLPLQRGENELLFAVSESFGGWGIMAAME